jgi:uncharacterized membrane protein SpoIIM required for sporulation
MITNRWIETRRKYWDRLTLLLDRATSAGPRGLSHKELREVALLYRQVAGDLSALRQEQSAKPLQAVLNTLLTRAHNLIYSQRKTSLLHIWHFFRRDYPPLFRRLLPYTLASLALMVAGALLGAALAIVRPEFMDHMLGPQMLATIHQHKMWTLSVNSMAPAASSAIMTNNLTVTFTAFALGITAGLGTIYMIVWNGILLGVVGVACAQHQMSLQLWSFVAPHGSLELPSIVIAGAAGLRLGAGLLFPGVYSRRHAIMLAGAESARLVAAVIPLLIVAGTFEGFFSPSTTIPIPINFVTGAILFSLLFTWLFLSGREHQPITRSAAPQINAASFTSR